MKYVCVMSCRDCTGVDPMGCFDGEPWEYGPYNTREEAEEKGRKGGGGRRSLGMGSKTSKKRLPYTRMVITRGSERSPFFISLVLF